MSNNDQLFWDDKMPTKEGIYMIDDIIHPERKVYIVEVGHCLQVLDNGDMYSLSEINGCDQWLWAFIAKG